MIVQDTIEKYISYAQELIRRIKSYQKIESSDVVKQLSASTAQYDVYFHADYTQDISAMYRVSFIPEKGGTPYVEMETLVGGQSIYIGFEYFDDPIEWTDRITKIVYLRNRYFNLDIFLKFRFRSIAKGTVLVEQI